MTIYYWYKMHGSSRKMVGSVYIEKNNIDYKYQYLGPSNATHTPQYNYNGYMAREEQLFDNR